MSLFDLFYNKSAAKMPKFGRGASKIGTDMPPIDNPENEVAAATNTGGNSGSPADAPSDEKMSWRNNYGLKAPKEPLDGHPGVKLFDRILGVGLPALASMQQGTGLIPGAAIGYLSGRAGEQENYRTKVDDYNKERLFRMKGDQGERSANLNELYKTAMIGLGRDRLNVQANKEPNKTEAETYAALQAKVDQAKMSGEIPSSEELILLNTLKKKLGLE